VSFHLVTYLVSLTHSCLTLGFTVKPLQDECSRYAISEYFVTVLNAQENHIRAPAERYDHELLVIDKTDSRLCHQKLHLKYRRDPVSYELRTYLA
jgi:hypothetical protein